MLTILKPKNELNRVIELANFDLDYLSHKNSFKDLTNLVAKIAGTSISLINLVDSFTQWSVANHGIEADQMPREDSVCQYTILSDDSFEVSDLAIDDRFKNKDYVVGNPHLRYYFGVPLKTSKGHNIGALCVLDQELRELSPEKVDMIKIIADEVVNRLNGIKTIETLKNQLAESRETQKKLAHDIRGPLSGIIGLTQIVSEQGNENQLDDVLEFITMINKGSKSILDLANEILTEDRSQSLKGNELNLVIFQEKLEKLYQPQAINKQINFEVRISEPSSLIPFSKNKLLQITGNLISNAMKFTPSGGSVIVTLDLILKDPGHILQIVVSDSGVGMYAKTINEILSGNTATTAGTSGEQGFGFGLSLVQHLVASLKGKMIIQSEPGKGTTFKISLPAILG